MTNFFAAFRGELLKARRSRVPLLTALGFSLAPLMGGFIMIILKDPDLARDIGLLRTKAQVISGTADWPSYFQLLAQATAVGGILLFSLITSWVFGREFVDRTAKDFLSLPTPRSTIITAKFVLVAFWSLILAAVIWVLGLGVGMAIGLPLWSFGLALENAASYTLTTFLTIAVLSPVAFVASAGRGYLLPMGFAIVALVLAQVLAAAGWGPLFPWSIPAVFARLGGPTSGGMEMGSYVVAVATCLAGVFGTLAWWKHADQFQ